MHLVSTLILICFLICLPSIDLSQNNKLENWFGDQHPAIKKWSSLKKDFSINESMILQWNETHQSYAKFNQLATNLNKICSKKWIAACFTPEHAIFLSEGISSLSEIEEDDWNTVLERVKQNPFFEKMFFSENNKISAYIEIKKEIGNEHKIIEKDLHEIGVNSFSSGILLNQEIQRISETDSKIYFAILPTVLTIFMLWITKSGLLTFIYISIQIVIVGITMGIASSIGYSMTAVSMIVPPMLICLTTASFFHIVYHSNQNQSVNTFIKDTLAKTWRVILMSKITTAAGFLTLCLSNLRTLQHTGILASFGLVVSFLVLYTFLPSLILLLKPQCFLRERVSKSQRYVSKLFQTLVSRHCKLLAAIFLSLLVPAFISFYQIQTSSHGIYMLPESNFIRQCMTKFENSNSVGSTRLEIFVPLKEFNPTYLKKIWGIQNNIEKLSQVHQVLSALDLLALAHFNIDSEYQISNEYGTLLEYKSAISDSPLKDLWNHFYDGSILRISFGISIPNKQDWKLLNSQINKLFNEQQLTYELSGLGYLEATMDLELMNVIFQSFSASVVVLLIILTFWTRSLTAGLAALIPNIMPVLMIFFLMKLLAIPSNVATSLIAGITLGIAVDDTLHFLSTWMIGTKSYEERYQYFLEHALTPITLTSIAMVAGYLIFLFAGFIPIKTFGIFMLIGAFVAWVSDCLFLPTLLTLLGFGRINEN